MAPQGQLCLSRLESSMYFFTSEVFLIYLFFLHNGSMRNREKNTQTMFCKKSNLEKNILTLLLAMLSYGAQICLVFQQKVFD